MRKPLVFLYTLAGMSIVWVILKQLGKPVTTLLIVLVCGSIAIGLARLGVVRGLDDAFYDAAYDLRRPVEGRDSPVVIVTADESSLSALAAGENHWAWPWPRQFWGGAAAYMQECGAKAVGIDLLFPEPSGYNRELGDDKAFASLVDPLRMPLVLAMEYNPDGTHFPFAPPIGNPTFGAVNLSDAGIVRAYLATYQGHPSLALRIVQSLGYSTPPWSNGPFYLHYYGPHLDRHNHPVFQYVPASSVFEAMQDPQNAKAHGIDPEIFKNKIVLFGTTATGAQSSDIKASPLDSIYPGVEIHATAIENLLKYQRVMVVPQIAVAGIAFLAAALATIAAMTPRRAWLKLLASGAAVIAILATTAFLFRREAIIWLPPMSGLMAAVLGIVLSLSWSYFAEDREARFFLRALGQYLSPHVAAELKRDRRKLALSSEKRELTILFSDIAHFTDISERLEERVGPLLNYYLDEMSQPVLAADGTLDKYIGDAVMCFWNAPVLQIDHPARACRAALAMKRRLEEIQPQLAELGAPGLSARIGINTGSCAFGNMGSRAKFNYSVIGDPCNFASRLEGAGKIYGTRILIGEITAARIHEQFVLRKIDMLRVQGKLKPVTIFELIAEGKPTPEQSRLICDYEAAFAHYRRQEWDLGEELLRRILDGSPADGPSRELLSRIAVFRHNPPAAPWDGVYVAKEK